MEKGTIKVLGDVSATTPNGESRLPKEMPTYRPASVVNVSSIISAICAEAWASLKSGAPSITTTLRPVPEGDGLSSAPE